MILVIDNYDSFTYNLVQYLGMHGAEVVVHRNDAITLDQIEALAPERILISPGPCSPTEAGISCSVIERFGPRMVVFGVCLGHQCIGQVFGGNIIRAQRLMHGKTSPIHHDTSGIFADLPSPFDATRYHSLIVEKETLPHTLRITAHTAENEIMGLQHTTLPIHGVQFHPESILTEHGMHMMANFLAL